MGVDYGAVSGFGFEVYLTEPPEGLTEEDYLEEVLGGTPYSCITAGNYYSDDRRSHFVIIDDVHPLETLEERCRHMREYLSEYHINTTDLEPDVVGGLLIS